MKRLYKNILGTGILIFICLLISSCGLIFGGPLTSCQTAKPMYGKRVIRKGYFLLDIALLPIALPVDFKTGAIYQPCNTNGKRAF